MKQLIYTVMLATSMFLAGCKTESDLYFDTPYQQFKIAVDYHAPNIVYEAQFGNTTFKLGNLPNQATWNPTLPASIFDANGMATGDLKIWKVAGGKRAETPEVFHVNLKKDTSLLFRHAADDKIRMLTTPEDEQQYITLGIQEKFLPLEYKYAVTFNDELLNISVFQRAYFHKDHAKGTLRFYELKGDNKTLTDFDATGIIPDITLSDYTVVNGATLQLFKPIGGALTIWKDEDAGKYATLTPKIVYGSSAQLTWRFKLGEEVLASQGASYVAKSSLSKSLAIYKVQGSVEQEQVYREVPGPFTDGQVLEFIQEGQELIPNTYAGPDPSKRTASFLKFGYLYSPSGRLQAAAVRIKVYLNLDGNKGRLLKEFQIDGKAGETVYAEPFEMDMAEFCPPGPAPDDDYLYMLALNVDTFDASTGRNIGSYYLEPLLYGKLASNGAYAWPFQLSHKQATAVLNGVQAGLGFIYASGLW